MDSITIITLLCLIESQIAIGLAVWGLVKKQNEKIVKEEVRVHVLGEVPTPEDTEDEDSLKPTNYNMLGFLKKDDLFDVARKIDL